MKRSNIQRKGEEDCFDDPWASAQLIVSDLAPLALMYIDLG